MTSRGISRSALLALWGVFLALPVAATMLYSVATVWRGRALPDGFTVHWWVQTLSEPRVVAALLAYGIKRLAGATEVTQPWEASPLLVVLGHVALAFPFFLWPVDGAMAAADVRNLSEAAETSGASPLSTLFRVVIPNIRTGILTGAILTFATSFGEYSIARVITGSSFETLPVWQVAALQDNRGNPNGVAVMAMFTFVLMFVVSVLIARTGRGEPVRLLPGINTTQKR
jgi:putative spermidine/putrescine transport system permease protein